MARRPRSKPLPGVKKGARAWPASAVIMRPVAELKRSPRNARKHSEDQIGRLVRVIERFGWTQPILVDEDGNVIAGHGRIMAAERMGLFEVPVMTATGWSPEEKAAYAIADNRIAETSTWDNDLLEENIADLIAADFDATMTGFSQPEIDKLIAPAESLTVKEVETFPVTDTFWISVRGPLESQAAILSALQAGAAGLQGVEIDVGVISLD